MLALAFALEEIVDHGNEEERHNGCVEQSADRGDRHRLQHSARGAAVAGGDDKSHDRGQGGDEDGSEASCARGDECRALLHALFDELVGEFDEDYAVVDDDAHEHDETEHRYDRDAHARDKEQEQAAREGERNGEHDDKGRFQRAELRRHDQIDEHDRHAENDIERVIYLLDLSRLLDELYLERGVGVRGVVSVDERLYLLAHPVCRSARFEAYGHGGISPAVLSVDGDHAFLRYEFAVFISVYERRGQEQIAQLDRAALDAADM